MVYTCDLCDEEFTVDRELVNEVVCDGCKRFAQTKGEKKHGRLYSTFDDNVRVSSKSSKKKRSRKKGLDKHVVA